MMVNEGRNLTNGCGWRGGNNPQWPPATTWQQRSGEHTVCTSLVIRGGLSVMVSNNFLNTATQKAFIDGVQSIT